MTPQDYVVILMFMIIGGTLAAGGIGITDKPIHFILIMLCASIIHILAKSSQ